MSLWHHDHVEKTESGISVENIREDVPKFERVYTARLDASATIKVTIRRSWGGSDLYKTGELTQPNGRWVLFDPNAIADKILDPALVPLVQKCVDEIYGLDRAYRSPEPSEFLDKRGVHYRTEAK
jgi:hypothetical protein